MSGEHRKQPEEQPSQEEPWLSHHDGRVTGTKVPPGAGDEEAGLTGDDPPTLEGDDDYGTPAYSVLDEAGFGFANDDESTKPAKEAESPCVSQQLVFFSYQVPSPVLQRRRTLATTDLSSSQ